jgi:nucleotidyltransferase/DNA polymerase involved in DNA repair
MVACVLIPRFALLGAIRGRRALLDAPVALAPEPGGVRRIGEVSAAAEAFGLAAGMGLGEALACCPQLRLVPPDPESGRALWASILDALEQVGARVESDLQGAAWFDCAGLRRVHGGDIRDVLAATRDALRRAGAGGARIGAGPSRFVAYAAALRGRPRRRSEVVEADRAAAFLAPLPVTLLRSRPELAELPGVLDQLGIRTLGGYAALPTAAVAERFGHPGLLALELACGRDTPLQPRRPPESVIERLELPEPASGIHLERALELLVGRVLARPERRGRSLRSVALSAGFVEGGTWRVRATLRRTSADPEPIRLALRLRLAQLPAPAEWLAVAVEAFGPPAHVQPRLVDQEGADSSRRTRLGEAIRQARSAAGDAAALRVMEVDPDSRVPERRAVLAPYPDADPP